MLNFIISAFKIIFMLGILVFIHEGGHFLVAKLFKIRVNEFALGFGPKIFTKEKGETLYALRLIPLGGFVDLEGESKPSDAEDSFSKASIPKRIAIVAAGGLVNIIFGILLYFLLVLTMTNFQSAILNTWGYIGEVIKSVIQLFTGKLNPDQLTGIVGISNIVVTTDGLREYIYIVSAISLSLGVTNLLPFPPLDGGKILIYIIEAIRRKKLKEETEAKLQGIGFLLIIALSIYVTYKDVLRLF